MCNQSRVMAADKLACDAGAVAAPSPIVADANFASDAEIILTTSDLRLAAGFSPWMVWSCMNLYASRCLARKSKTRPLPQTGQWCCANTTSDFGAYCSRASFKYLAQASASRTWVPRIG